MEPTRDYHAAKKAPRTQALEKWLLQCETTFAEAGKLQLAEIQDNKALYDFILAIRSIGSAYASAYQVYVDSKLEEDTDIPSLYDAVERFRNNLRLTRATSRSYTHTAFVTLQGEEATKLSADSAGSAEERPQ